MCPRWYFYPRPPRGGRRRCSTRLLSQAHFYPRPPRGGRQFAPTMVMWPPIFLSTPSARRATSSKATIKRVQTHFYPRPPRGGRPLGPCRNLPCEYFYPRPPRGGRQHLRPGSGRRTAISIHALREEGDHDGVLRPAGSDQFLSTPSARRATEIRQIVSSTFDISIHALREEGDSTRSPAFKLLSNFYPRPPRGGRPLDRGHAMCTQQISIHALREEGDVAVVVLGVAAEHISIHALREEGDSGWRPRPPWRCNFYPRPPRGGRPTATS